MPNKTVITSTTIGSSTPGILKSARVGPIVKPGVRKPVRDLLIGRKPRK